VGRCVRHLESSDRHGDRELDPEAGLHAVGEVTAPDGDLAAVFLDEFLCDPKTDPGSDVVLGGEEGVKDAAELTFGDADTVVFDGEDCSCVVAGDGDEDAGVGTVEGVQGVGDEVGGDLAELVRGDGDKNVILKLPLNVNFFHLVAMAKDGEHVFDGVGDENRLTGDAVADEAEVRRVMLPRRASSSSAVER